MNVVESIGVVGGGVVGRATARTYVEFTEVRVWDRIPERATHALQDVARCDLVFVCLPTPSGKDGLLDVSALRGFFESLVNLPGVSENIVIKSTVPVGTTAILARDYRLSICHSPEFLTERCALTDALIPSRNVLGVPNSQLDLPLAALVYQERFPGVPLHVVSSDASEALKLFQNAYFAAKVSLFNEFYSYCLSERIDWQTVRGALLADGRIAHSHTQVPGPDGQRGWGGNCLPKDLKCLIRQMEEAGESPVVLSAVVERNYSYDRREE